MKDLVLTEQIRCPWCRRKFTGIIRFLDKGRPYVLCMNSHCDKLIMGDDLNATVGRQDLRDIEKLASGQWPGR